MLILTRARKSVLCVLWAWLILYIPLFIAYVFGLTVLMQSATRGDGSDDLMLWSFAAVFILHALTILSLLGQAIFYIWHAATKNPRLNQSQTLLWAALILVLGGVTIPIYWWQYIRTAPENHEELEAQMSTHSSVAQIMT